MGLHRAKPSNAINIILALPMKESVQRFMRRSAFGGQQTRFVTAASMKSVSVTNASCGC